MQSDLDEQIDPLQKHRRTRGGASETISLIRRDRRRTVRRVRRRRRSRDVLRELHRLRRISHQPATADDDRLPPFTSTPMVGRAAANKGLALFPRRIRGRFAAMSRSDRESNAVAYSDNPFEWTTSEPSPTADARLGGRADPRLRGRPSKPKPVGIGDATIGLATVPMKAPLAELRW